MVIVSISQSQDPIEPCKHAESLESQQSYDKSPNDLEIPSLFGDRWCEARDDNCLILNGFRRFRTTHLLELCYLKKKIDTLDHKIFRAGLKLEKHLCLFTNWVFNMGK